jgi:hypothetical protein
MRVLCLAVLLLSASVYCAEERVWVVMEVLLDGKDKIISISGNALKKDFDETVVGTKKGYLPLSNVFWFDGPRIVRQVDQGGFAGKCAYRLETILRITLYSDEYIAKIMPELMAPAKGGQVPEKPVAPPKPEF